MRPEHAAGVGCATDRRRGRRREAERRRCASRSRCGSRIRRPLRTTLGRAATTTRPSGDPRSRTRAIDAPVCSSSESPSSTRSSQLAVPARSESMVLSTWSSGTSAGPLVGCKGDRAGAIRTGSMQASPAHLASAARSVERPDRDGPVTKTASYGRSWRTAGSSVRTLIPMGRVHRSGPISASRRDGGQRHHFWEPCDGCGPAGDRARLTALRRRGERDLQLEVERTPPAPPGRRRSRARHPHPERRPLDGIGDVEHEPLAGGGGDRRGQRADPIGAERSVDADRGAADEHLLEGVDEMQVAGLVEGGEHRTDPIDEQHDRGVGLQQVPSRAGEPALCGAGR